MSLKIDSINFTGKAHRASRSHYIPVNGEETPEIKNLSNVTMPSNVVKLSLATDKTRLGANRNEKTNKTDFKLASKSATDVFLFTFDNPKDEKPSSFTRMKKDENGIWCASLDNQKTPLYYGYRVFGPNWEYSEDFFNPDGTINNPKAGFKSILGENGERFNPNKIAFDPCAKGLSHLPSDNPSGSQGIYFSKENLFEDNAAYAPKGVFAPVKDSVIKKTSIRPLTDEIIGEVHVKDLTMLSDDEAKGTYKAAGNAAKKVKETGVTMVEFLPLTEFDDKDSDNNHWGYMPLGFFAPAKKYSHNKEDGKALEEFREMINAFHKEDIKVCMDVVYNHTGEGAVRNNDKEDAKCLSFALIDNPMYYKTQKGYYNSNSGCGNDLNTADSEVSDFIADSIAFWAKQGVDAFRFDLAAALLDNDPTGKVFYDKETGLAAKLPQKLAERGVKVNAPNEKGDGIYLIAEPWTCGGDYSYQISNFPEHWAVWNDKTRETVKRSAFFPESMTPGSLKMLLEGSPDILTKGNRSVNYAFSHDGYCMYDANSFNSPPGSWQFSTDHGGNEYMQRLSMKKEIALVLLAKGTSMLQIGDIIAHSKGGNENSYNCDDETNYLDFSKTEVPGSTQDIIYDFSRKMIQFRKDRKCISRQTEKPTYYTRHGRRIASDEHEYWNHPGLSVFCAKIGSKKPVFVAVSECMDNKEVTLPENNPGKCWKLVFDTSKDYSFDTSYENIKSCIIKPNAVMGFEEVNAPL